MARRLLSLGIVLAVLAAVAYGGWAWLSARHRVSTEDAYVERSIVTISAHVPGPVARDFLRLAALFVVMIPLVWVMRRPAETPHPQPSDAA